jgi:hypothetical protein
MKQSCEREESVAIKARILSTNPTTIIINFDDNEYLYFAPDMDDEHLTYIVKCINTGKRRGWAIQAIKKIGKHRKITK